MKCRCGSGLIAGLNGRCAECNREAGVKGHQTRMLSRRIADYFTGVEARLCAARARLAHDLNVDWLDRRAGDVIVNLIEFQPVDLAAQHQEVNL